jgi:hypothetical protein
MTDLNVLQQVAAVLSQHRREAALHREAYCKCGAPIGEYGSELLEHRARELDKAGLLARRLTLHAVVNRLVDASPVRLTIGRGGPSIGTATVRPDGTADLAVDAVAARDLGLADGDAISVTVPQPEWGVRYATDGHVVPVHPNTRREADRYALVMRIGGTDVEVVCRPRPVEWTTPPAAEGGEGR